MARDPKDLSRTRVADLSRVRIEIMAIIMHRDRYRTSRYVLLSH